MNRPPGDWHALDAQGCEWPRAPPLPPAEPAAEGPSPQGGAGDGLVLCVVHGQMRALRHCKSLDFVHGRMTHEGYAGKRCKEAVIGNQIATWGFRRLGVGGSLRVRSGEGHDGGVRGDGWAAACALPVFPTYPEKGGKERPGIPYRQHEGSVGSHVG